jgi:hypothetical protein
MSVSHMPFGYKKFNKAALIDLQVLVCSSAGEKGGNILWQL